ncbi:hypothetical protein M3Y99_01579500 [Aphelenchoides fujianensis]|nr:hypothetical protein M3Y99_01579500 [Aphelenchoides fujianensis]
MYAFLFLLLVPTIAAAPLDANEWSDFLFASNALPNQDLDLLPHSIVADLVQQILKRYREVQPCIANETAHHANVTEELRHRIEAICFAKAGYGDFVLLANTAVSEAVHGKQEYDDECVKALTGLKWKEDPRLNASIPLSKENRKDVCTFLGDFNEQFCRIQKACAMSPEQLLHDFAQLYSALHVVATDGTITDENCLVVSVPFFHKINPHAFTADFDARQEVLLVPSPCDDPPVPLQ